MTLFTLVSCKHEIPVPETAANGGGNGGNGGNGGGNPPAGVPCDPNKIYWARDIRPIIITNCTMYEAAGDGCHDPIRQADGINLTTYQNLYNQTDLDEGFGSDFYEALTESDPDKRMPLGRPPLTAAQMALINQWIAQGADSLYCDWACDTAIVTFSASVWPVIDANCRNCHSGPNPANGISLTNHAEVAARTQTGQLIGAIKHLPGYYKMPKGYTLSTCDIRKIELWNDAGRPNN